MDYSRPPREANQIAYLVHAGWVGGMIDTILNSADEVFIDKEQLLSELERTLEGEVILDGYTDIPIVMDLKDRLKTQLKILKDSSSIDEEVIWPPNMK